MSTKGGGSLGVAAAVGAGLLLAAHHPAAHRGGRRTELAAKAVRLDGNDAAANEALGDRMAAARGWTGVQRTCLNMLWTRESGWRIVANYQGSGAYGIPQALPAGKMRSAGADYMTDPRTEIRWGLGYIRQRYGSPCGAWAHETDKGWY